MNASSRSPFGVIEGRRAIAGFLGIAGLLAYITAMIAIQPLQWNVVTYAVEVQSHVPRRALSVAFAVLLGLAPAVCAWTGARRRRGGLGATLFDALGTLWPLLLSLPLAVAAWRQTGPLFPLSLLHIIGTGWAIERSFNGLAKRTASNQEIPPLAVVPNQSSGRQRGGWWAVGSLAVMVVVPTWVHTRLQINFFEHFMLGHADMGHFAEELKNALAGRGLRSDSFPNTRLGWHFTPLLYVLVPGYWLWPSPVYLMMCSGLFVHLAAFPVYWFSRRWTSSCFTAWLLAVAWLVHPSISRLPYSGTYGFQWLYVTLPLLIWWIGAGWLGRWRTFSILLAILLLCRETTTATTLGFGLFLLLVQRRRTVGLSTVIVSSLFAIVCVSWIIPAFAVSGEYERARVYGVLGSSFTELMASAGTQPAIFFGRFIRHESIMFVIVLCVTMSLAPIRRWRLGLSAAPALILILLMENPQWLSIKFWYQASILPLWFACAIISSSDSTLDRPSESKPRSGRCPMGYALSILTCCAWGHYLLGFSPLSKSYDLYAADARLQAPDPALAMVHKWRREIPRDATILATERLAAHFTDYRRIYTGARPLPADYVLIDRQDHWDATGLAQRAEDFRADSDYRVYDEFGSLIVFERRPDRRVAPQD